jgi:DNA-directed RNA polymerase specialized sigma24 family protein
LFAIASEQAEETSEALEIERNFKVLEGCVEKLPATLRAVVEARYREGGSLNTVAQLSNRSTNAVKLLLIRARRALSDCVRLASAEEVEA